MNNKTQDYWEHNINKWANLYLEKSNFEERFDRPKWMQLIYNCLITPIEATLMTKRFKITSDFIDHYIKPGMTVVDVGCGTGIFTVMMLERGAIVKAVDFAQSALDETRKAVERITPDKKEKAEYLLIDVEKKPIPRADVALAMGVTPYVSNLESFYAHILPNTDLFYCLIMDPSHWINKIRKNIPFLNVRDLNFFEKDYVDALLSTNEWKLLERRDFATGFIDIAEKIVR